MDWTLGWRQLKIMAEAGIEATKAFIEASTTTQRNDEMGSLDGLLLPSMRGTLEGIVSFLKDNAARLPQPAANNLATLLQKESWKIEKTSGYPAANALIPVLMIATAAIERLLAEDDVLFVPIVERAFIHLQRLLIVDARGSGALWTQALSAGETECEKLGGAHLLSHGVFGFKAHGAGARTDLVLQTPIANDDEARRAGAPLVLTEWKVARSQDAVTEAIRRADSQVLDYGDGILGGLELHRTRYVVVVSTDRL